MVIIIIIVIIVIMVIIIIMNDTYQQMPKRNARIVRIAELMLKALQQGEVVVFNDYDEGKHYNR